MRKPAVLHPSGPLAVTRNDPDTRQAQIESNHQHLKGNFDDYYVHFSGYFGSHGPHVFAVAPELLAAAIKHLDALDEEAKASLSLSNAEANFSSSRLESKRAERAMLAASQAAKELRALIAKATRGGA